MRERASKRASLRQDGHEVPESTQAFRPSHFAAANISRLHQSYAVLGSTDSIIFNFSPKTSFRTLFVVHGQS